MEKYQHSLFFKAGELTDEEKRKVWRYFQKKRDSGGGDCGPVTKVGDNTYQICFKEKKDQEKVLERKEHTVTLPHQELRLIVIQIKSPADPVSTDQPSTSQPQTFTKANTQGRKKIFRIDIYLIYYLRDNPKALKLLQKQLSSIGCTVEFNFDEEEAIVRGDIEKGPGGAFGAAETWELQVDRVFIELSKTYICHHVMESKQTKILLQDRSSLSDDIKVYPEIGYSVVVGEAQAVKRRIAVLEKSTPTRKEVPVVEKKFKLIEEEFKGEMHVRYPKVKILTGNAMIILEGPDEEVQSAVTKLDQLMKTVIEKRVKLPADLLTFMKSSDVISKYQTRFQQSLRNPVSIEVGSDLILSSLSSGALDDAWTALNRDLSVETVQLQGTVAVPPELDQVKEILIKAKNEANSQEFRVDVSYIPGNTETKVRLVGYNENVNQLKEVLYDYQMNRVGTQEVLNLPYPELVDCFDKILDLTAWKQTKATIKASLFPQPCVLVSGPRCNVLEVKADLEATLSSLMSHTLVLDGPGVQQFFKGEGRKNKALVESHYQVVLVEQQCANPQSTATASYLCKRFQNSTTSTTRWRCNNVDSTTNMTTVSINQTTLEIKIGSVVDEQVNVLVAPMINKKLTSTKIGKGLNATGNAMIRNFDLATRKWTLVSGDVVQVNAPPTLGFSKIFFIECLPWSNISGICKQALSKGLRTCLDHCVQQGQSSVALPVIGPGVALKYPVREAVQVLTESIFQFGLSAAAGALSTIHVVIKPGYPNSEEIYHEVHRHLRLNMNHRGQLIFRSLTSDLDNVTVTLGGGVKLHLVFGDITNETTDVIVNTTDFANFQNGVCKDILRVAGPQVEAQLRKAKGNKGEVFQTGPGSFPCKAIFHVCAQRNTGVIEQLAYRIIQQCSSLGYKSVAIPAICAGAGELDSGQVAHAIFRGVNSITSSSLVPSITDIRLVMIKINVFLVFKKQAEQMFHRTVINTVSVSPFPPPVTTVDLSILRTTSTVQRSAFLITGLSRKRVDDAMTKLKDLYEAQCSTQILNKDDLAGLNQDDVKSLKQLVKSLGLYVEEDQSDQGRWMVSGLKDGVNQVMQMICQLTLSRVRTMTH